jgi:hypothetical protein
VADLKAGLKSVHQRQQTPERKVYHLDMMHIRVMFLVVRKRVKTKKSDNVFSEQIDK